MIVSDNGLRSSKKRQSVLMCCDNNYFPYAALFARQIRAAHPMDAFDICIMMPDAHEETPLIEELQLRIIKVKIPKEWGAFDTNKQIPLIAYLRIISPDLLQDEYDRILYLDCDTTYVRGNLSELFDLDLKGRPVAAVLNGGFIRKPKRYAPEFKATKMKKAAYFASGLLLFDVKEYILQDIAKRALEYAQHADPKAKIYHDQSALNLALHNNWAELSATWNWPYWHRTFFFAHFFAPCMVANLGPNKLWSDQLGVNSAAQVLELKNGLETYFPERYQALDIRHSIDVKPVIAWYMFIQHALDFKRTVRYLKRFSHDLEVM